MIKDNIKNFIGKKNNKVKIIVAVGVLGILLIFASDVIPSSSQTTKAEKSEYTYDFDSYKKSLQKELLETISSVDGVGECKVMITLDTSNEYVYAKNSKNSSSNTENESEDEYALYEKNGDNTPLLIKQYFPKVKGVVIVCDGGDNVYVKSAVTESVSALFDIPSSRISITKINSENR